MAKRQNKKESERKIIEASNVRIIIVPLTEQMKNRTNKVKVARIKKNKDANQLG